MALPATRQWHLNITTVVPYEHCMECSYSELMLACLYRTLLKKMLNHVVHYRWVSLCHIWSSKVNFHTLPAGSILRSKKYMKLESIIIIISSGPSNSIICTIRYHVKARARVLYCYGLPHTAALGKIQRVWCPLKQFSFQIIVNRD